MSTLWGKNTRQYVLDKKLGSGGEGEVYSIIGMPDIVAKIYNLQHFSSLASQTEMQDKLSTMIDMRVNPYYEGHLLIAWPKDILYDDKGSFAGFVMPKVENRVPILCAFIPTERDRLFPNYTWEVSPKIAYNLATTVAYLHDCVGVTIGDLNTENFMIDSDGFITAIDVDSFTINKGGHSFKCKAGVPEMLAPELQGKDLSLPSTVFTKESDLFSLAVLIFQILVNGVHPFGMPNNSMRGVSTGRNAVVANIVTGYCPYTTSSSGKQNIEAYDMDMLPSYIRNMFDRVFNYNAHTAILPQTIARRPSASEWANALYMLTKEDLSHCPREHKHVYPKSYKKGCPWCEINKRTAYHTPVLINYPASGNVSSGGGSNSAVYQTSNTCSPVARSSWPLFTLFPLVGALGTMIFTADMSSFANGIDLSLSNNVASIILAAVGCIVGLILASFVSEHYKKSSYPYAWLLLAVIVPIIALIGSVVLVLGLYLALAALVLGIICYIFSNL